MYVNQPTRAGVGQADKAVQPYAVLDQFASGSSMLANKHYHQIGRIARYVLGQQKTSQPIRWIHVVGYTDPVGNNLKNCRLSMIRAKVVLLKLMKQIVVWNGGKVPPQLGVIREGRGQAQPIVGDRARSRRVEVFLFTSQAPPEVLHMCPQPSYCMCDR